MERCRSGRTGRSRKPLSSLRGTEGSNPSLSAILVFLAVSGRLTHHENSRVLKPFPSPLISDCIGQSQPRWGKEWGKSGENPIGPLPFGQPGKTAMARIGKLTAVEVTKTK